MMDKFDPILKASCLGKRYGATTALDDVSLMLNSGEVCGLLGENGAGKSTLVKILSGIVSSDEGEIILDEKPYRPLNTLDAKTHGVCTAFQELSLIPTLSVAVNLFLPKPKVNAFRLVSMRSLEEAAESTLVQYGIVGVAPSTLVGDLPLGLRQRIEIVRAIFRMPRVLLLDEPTAALSDREWLFELIADLVKRGTSILYITHKLDEVRRLCQRCVVLRNGKKVWDAPVADLTDEDIFSKMAGRSIVEAFPARKSSTDFELDPVLDVQRLIATGVNDVSFSIRKGEVLGVAALEGQGQSDLFKTLVGLTPSSGGLIHIDGKRFVAKSPRVARAAGIVLVPEERKSDGLFNDLSTAANVSISVINKVSAFDLIQKRKEREVVEAGAAKVDLHKRYLRPNIEALSGGNQQKAILARALLADPKCLLLFDPTRGVDVGTKQNIYKVIREFVKEGGATLLYSTELDELVHLCDRCMVIYRGAIVAMLEASELTPNLLLALAAGHRAEIHQEN
jgi:ribose transport system ATP-binding protein